MEDIMTRQQSAMRFSGGVLVVTGILFTLTALPALHFFRTSFSEAGSLANPNNPFWNLGSITFAGRNCRWD